MSLARLLRGDRGYRPGEGMIEACDAVLLWNPGTADVRSLHVANYGSQLLNGNRRCCCSLGAVDADWCEEMKDPVVARAVLFIEAMHLIVRDKCDPQAVHQAFLAIAEYSAGCSSDMPGIARARSVWSP